MSRPNTRLFVGNLPSDVRTSEVERLFDKYGPIRDIDVKLPPSGRRGPAFAFVEYDDIRDADDAQRRRDGYDFDGAPIRVEFARSGPGDRRGPRERRPPRAPAPKIRRGEFRVVVSSLPPQTSWQDLKDHMRRAGDVCFSEVSGDGRGAVEYLNSSDYKYALKELDGSTLRNRYGDTARIMVDPSADASRSRSRSPYSRSRSRSPRSRSRSATPLSVRSRSPRSRSRSPTPRSRSRSPVARSRSPSPPNGDAVDGSPRNDLPPRDRSPSPRDRSRSPSPRARSASPRRSRSPSPRD